MQWLLRWAAENGCYFASFHGRALAQNARPLESSLAEVTGMMGLYLCIAHLSWGVCDAMIAKVSGWKRLLFATFYRKMKVFTKCIWRESDRSSPKMPIKTSKIQTTIQFPCQKHTISKYLLNVFSAFNSDSISICFNHFERSLMLEACKVISVRLD